MPKCTIDGRPIDVGAGTTIMQAARELGIAIPHFCWHADLSVDGSCRMCVVEIEKQPKLQISCNTAVSDGMVVRTDTPRVRAARRSTLELLLVNHPIDCPVCDQAGECYLQDQYQAYTLHDARTALEEKVRKRKVVDIGPIVLDAERCVLCSRCLRFEREVVGTSQLTFVGRGDQTQITTFEGRPITHAYAGNLADVCPVGALLSRDFRFKMRVWFLAQTPSICPGCSTGCNVYIDHRDGEIYRLRPRRNPAVNKSWLCDPGRALYRRVAAPGRLTAARLRAGAGSASSPEAALALLAERIGAARQGLAILGTPQATNESLFLLRRLADATGGLLDFRVGDPQLRLCEREDSILQRADRNPNTQGALDLGIGRSGVDEIVAACRSGAVHTLLLAGPELLRLPAAGMFLEHVPFVAVMATHDEPALERAHLVLPVSEWAEHDGTFTNFERRVQRIQRAFAPPGDARPRWEMVADLLGRLGMPPTETTASAVFAEMARVTPGYVGLDYRALGEQGRRTNPAEGSDPSQEHEG